MNRWLLDTGPIVAYLDQSDPFHKVTARQLGRFTGQLLTTGAVVTEAMHFVAAVPQGPALLVDFLVDVEARIFDFAQLPELRRAAPLMKRYANVPMDFADATLLLLADAEKVREICTLDRRGFTVFRTPRGRHLNIAGAL